MARSKRLRECEITTENEVQLNSNEPSPVSQTEQISEHDADASSNSDSDSASENEPQIQEQADHEYNDTLEIEDDQGHTMNKQGMTRAKDVWNLPNGQRIVIKCNKFGQPVKKGGGILGGWLGTLFRKENFCSLCYNSWKKVPNTVKTELIQLTRLYSRIGWASRAKHTTPHTTGSMSFARKRQEFEEKNQREPGRIEFFAVTHKSKDGSYINTAANNFVSDAMVKVNASITSESSASAAELENDAFICIKGKDRYG